MIELKVRLGAKGQVVIPKIFRDNYKIYPKQEVVIMADSEGVLIKKQDDNFIERLREISKEISKKRKGKPFVYNKKVFYEQYDQRARRAGIKI